ncbi:LysR family transcriptional regulator [Curvivirga aplysinae]|uniref:LysR family transcriptional regulator n=1 Tax=Curvivirga aplysinae TaxID=2529852 RepID=UPI0012BCFF58|nr:LysR family transcriptional regulator [Curvivirga aplysinae]MTI09852.1 LysR family transcriptional regulator [Curvivirga aplysinae]
MNIEHMRAFLEVAATGSFQLAADKLHVTQSTISARIKALEERLNRQLFVRRRNGAELTAGGHHFHRHALTAVRSWDRARQEIALPDDMKAIVNLGVQLNHWDRIAAPWLNWMNSNASNLAAQIVSEYSEPLMHRLRDGLLDLAILYDPQQRPELVIESFLVEKLILISTTPRQVEAERVQGYIFVDWGDSFKAQHSLAFPNAPSPKLSVGIGSVGLNHILQHGGSGYFIEETVKPLIAEGRLFRVKDAPEFKRPTYLVYQDNPSDHDLLETAIKGLRSILPDTV